MESSMKLGRRAVIFYQRSTSILMPASSKEHKHPDARKQLADKWKMWIGQDTFQQRREAAKAKQQAAAQPELPEYDD